MAVSTVVEYLSALEKSKLLGSEQLVEAQRLAGESSDAPALAKALARDNLVSRWQASTLLALGQRAQLRLGKYKLIQRLGKGGMGTVFLAEHVTMNRRVALKIVPRSIAEDRASLDRFFAEARAIAALDHPNIVQAYSVDNEMDRYFIVMEFVDGQDLQQLVELNGPLDFDLAANYIRQAAEGLAHAHARNLVHCDIKPSNLLVNQQGVVKILDLGLARLNRSDEPRGTAAGEAAFGTVDYMAPEQALETANFDHRADIYSLGCTLYCLLTGHPPFPEGTLAQRIVKHQTQEPRDILLERPTTPPKLVEICKRMMAKEPEARYQSMQEVSAALAPLLSGSNGAVPRRAAQAVRPLQDTALSAADDSLAFLTALSPSNAGANGAAASDSAAAAAGKPGRSGKQQTLVRQSGGIAAGLAAVWAKRAWFNTTRRKIAGAAVGAALLAAVAGLAAVPFLLSPPKPPPQTAQNVKTEEKKVVVEEEVGFPPDKSAEIKPSAAHGSNEKNVPAGKAAASPKPKQPSGNPQKIVPPKSHDAGKASPKHDTTPVPKTDAKTIAKVDVKPVSPQKPVAAKPVSWDGLAAAVDLPPLDKGGKDEAVSLGKLDLDPKLAVNLQLLGGDSVAKSPILGNLRFELQKEGDGAPPAWSIQMAGKNKDKDPLKIAQVGQQGGEWKIKWEGNAKDKATLLRYCKLQFTCEKSTHFVALCTPKIVSPLVIDVDAGASRPRFLSNFPLPDLSVLRLQVLPLDQNLPKHEIKVLESRARGGRQGRGKPVEPVKGDKVPVKGQLFVAFTKDKTPRVIVSIAFEAHMKDVQLDMQAGCEIAGNMLPFNFASLQGADARLGAYLMANDSDKNPNKKNMQAQIQAWKTARDQLKALGDLGGELNQKASIPFRVYAILGENDDEASKVVIFQSGQVENAKAGGIKKNAKGNNKKKGGAASDVEDFK